MNNISDLVYDLINDQTGLIVPKDVFQISSDDSFLIIKSQGKIILKIDKELSEHDDIFEEMITENMRELKDQIIDYIIIKEELRLKNDFSKLKEFIESKLRKTGKNNTIQINLENIGYQGDHWELEEEYTLGMPIILLRITDFKDININIETEFENNKIIFDIRNIKNKISVHIN